MTQAGSKAPRVAVPQAGAPRVDRPITPLPPPADLAKATDVQWVSDFGPGGMTVSPSADVPQDDPADGLTSVTAVVFSDPSEREISFVGVREPGRPIVPRTELRDAFVLAYLALGQGAYPGVSIDPRPGQLGGGLREGDHMDVVYFGDSAGSELGLTAFEADRVMKCLSLGKDNLTGQPMPCGVAGYQSELALSARREGGEGHSWHRFWIEMGRSDVAHSSDGRTWMVKPRLAVNTEYMNVKGGKLVSGNRPPDPAAKQFADHLAEHYDEYARENPALAKLAAFAALTSVAAAIHEDAAAAGLREALDGPWRLYEYEVEKRPTPATTPATVASTTTDRHVVQLTGGVRLKPENRYHANPSTSDAVQRAVNAARAQGPSLTPQTVELAGRPQSVLPTRLKSPRRLWQEDLRVGPIAVVRQWGPRDALGEPTPGWYLRMPRVRLSDELVDYQGGERAPRSAFLYEEDGTRVALPKFGSATLPGNPATAMYSTTDGARRLCLYKNVWLYLEGKIDFVSVNGGSPQMRLGEKARVIRFASGETEKHRVEEVVRPGDTVQYHYEGDRLSALRDPRGNAIRFSYDAQGRLKGLEGSNGRRVDYHFDAKGRMRYLSDDRGKLLTYAYGRSSPDPAGVIGDFQKSPVDKCQPVAQAFVRQKSGKPSWTVADPAARYVSLDRLPGPEGGYELGIQGGAAKLDAPLRLPTHYTHEMAAEAMSKLVAALAPQGVKTVVVGGDADVANELAIAMRKAAPELAVFTTASPESAARNLYAPPSGNGKTRVLVHRAGLARRVREALAEYKDGPSDAGTVILVGHNQPEFVAFVREQGDAGAFRGRDVVLVTCGDDASNMPGVVEDVLRSYDAKSVTGFTQAIRQALIPHLIGGMTTRLARTPAPSPDVSPLRKDQTIERVIRETVEEIRGKKDRREPGQPATKEDRGKPLPASVTPADIDVLDYNYEQANRHRRPGRFLVQRGRERVIMGGGWSLSGVVGHSIVRLAA